MEKDEEIEEFLEELEGESITQEDRRMW